MEIVVEEKQISNLERVQISQQVKAELIEHLYRGCLPGTITGIPVGIIFFVAFYGFTPIIPLTIWFISYNFALVGLTSLFFFYKHNKEKYTLDTWLTAYSIMLSVCALMWGISIFLIPENSTRRYFAFIALFILSTGYATGTIGVFRLCVATLTIIVGTLTVWFFLQGTFLYNLIGLFSLLYFGFMLSINRRSTEWFKESLKLKLENNLVSYQANHDLLTELPNQRILPQYVETAIRTVRNTPTTFALICFSLNRMEMINDSLGHQAGDSLIQSVANRLNTFAQKLSSSRDSNGAQYIVTISRKDTFNILIVSIKPEEAEEKTQILFSVLDDPFYVENKGLKLTASMGVSLYGKDADNAEALLIKADAAMLKAKQFGGNRLEFYRSEINAQNPKQLELETDLHNALKNNQLQVYYQPLIDLRTGQICGMEALIRWIHPVHGFIPPLNFIPIAEATGLIIPIGEWVLQTSCEQTRKWHQMGFTTLKIAVNVAEKQLRQENFIGNVVRVLKKTEFNPKFLELEITETAILDESIIHLVKEFKKLGLSLAVDDFGTGYSGLSYLKRFSIDKLKIDQSFIRDIPGNNDSITIVNAIIAMAKELNVKTLAEGVETEEQLNFLKNKGCDFVQGYYYSKPIPADAFTQLLLKHQKSLSSVQLI